MKTFIAGQVARTVDDALELAPGTPLDLWLGVEGESDRRSARPALTRPATSSPTTRNCSTASPRWPPA